MSEVPVVDNQEDWQRLADEAQSGQVHEALQPHVNRMLAEHGVVLTEPSEPGAEESPEAPSNPGHHHASRSNSGEVVDTVRQARLERAQAWIDHHTITQIDTIHGKLRSLDSSADVPHDIASEVAEKFVNVTDWQLAGRNALFTKALESADVLRPELLIKGVKSGSLEPLIVHKDKFVFDADDLKPLYSDSETGKEDIARKAEVLLDPDMFLLVADRISDTFDSELAEHILIHRNIISRYRQNDPNNFNFDQAIITILGDTSATEQMRGFAQSMISDQSDEENVWLSYISEHISDRNPELSDQYARGLEAALAAAQNNEDEAMAQLAAESLSEDVRRSIERSSPDKRWVLRRLEQSIAWNSGEAELRDDIMRVLDHDYSSVDEACRQADALLDGLAELDITYGNLSQHAKQMIKSPNALVPHVMRQRIDILRQLKDFDFSDAGAGLKDQIEYELLRQLGSDFYSHLDKNAALDEFNRRLERLQSISVSELVAAVGSHSELKPFQSYLLRQLIGPGEGAIDEAVEKIRLLSSPDTRQLLSTAAYSPAFRDELLNKLVNGRDYKQLLAQLTILTNDGVPLESMDRERRGYLLRAIAADTQEAGETVRERLSVLAAADMLATDGDIAFVLQNDTLIRSILRGDMSPAMAAFGITESGEAGVVQLKNGMQEFRKHILSTPDLDTQTLELVKENAFARMVLQDVTRQATSQWGRHSGEDLIKLIDYTEQAKQDGRLETSLGTAYASSGVVEIATVESTKEKAAWTDDLLGRYDVLRQELLAVARITEKPGAFNNLFDALRDEVATLVASSDEVLKTGISRKTGQPMTEREYEGYLRARDQLASLIEPESVSRPDKYPLRSLRGFEDNFKLLARNSALHPAMRKLAFAWALRKNSQFERTIANLPEHPSMEAVSGVREFVEHIVNQETFQEYFTDKRSARLFREMTSTTALENALLRQQGVGVAKGTTSVQFIPTRGLMMELSGHIGDACWASKYDSIAETMPNMRAVIMKQNPGDPQREKLVGSGMLIETTDTNTGEPVLVIRGLNPIENFINKVSVEDFYDSFIGYAREIAEKTGRKLAIVIDNHAGGSATNRPMLFGYLAAKKQYFKRVPVSGKDTSFNGYDITNNVYEL